METYDVASRFDRIKVPVLYVLSRTDALFQMLPASSFYDRPVPERHRLIFYLGHLEAFDSNLFAPVLGLKSHDPKFDKLFAFGIDPVGGGLPTDVPADWPSIR